MDKTLLYSPKQLLYFATGLMAFLFLVVPLATPLTFNFPANDIKINKTGNVSVSEKSIALTGNEEEKFKKGRITFSEPVHLWDKKSNNLTNFYTNFTFTITPLNTTFYGDGMAFFLAPTGSLPLVDGKGLGLPGKNQIFVAVEFDTYRNPDIDPPPSDNPGNGDHVGIDINSMFSIQSKAWYSGVSESRTNHASIKYESGTKNLSVTFSNFDSNNNETWEQTLSYLVDLKDYLPELVAVGFSAATGDLSEMHTLQSWYFTSDLQITDEPVQPPNDEPIQPPNASAPIVNDDPPKKRSIGIAVGLGAGGGFVFFIALIISFFVWKKNRKERNFDNDGVAEDFEFSTDDDFENGTGPRKFSYNDLARATDNFSEQEKLGEGGFGSVYRGFSRELNCYIAVKRVSSSSKQGKKEFASEVKIISRLRHRNLVKLIGWCHEKRELLLVYEFMPNGSLDSHLFKHNTLLTWDSRYKIAQGIASGLLYLQEEWEQCVLHRDIKSSNIMLDSDFNAKLGDFGLARLVDHGKGPETTILAGTLGYLAPECVVTGKASKESDVYSYGVVALEIACGRKPTNYKASEDQIYMIQWVWDHYGGENLKLLEAADPRLNGDFDEQQMERLMIVGLWCVYPDSNLRPSIRQAIQVLNFEAMLPNLPSKMPVPTYFPPPAPLSSFSLSLEVTGNQNQSSSYTTDFSQVTSSSSGSSTSALLMHSR